MQTLTIKISDKVYGKVLWFLSKFSKEEIEILSDEGSYVDAAVYLENELNEMMSGKASYHSLEEFNDQLEDAIREHEN